MAENFLALEEQREAAATETLNLVRNTDNFISIQLHQRLTMLTDMVESSNIRAGRIEQRLTGLTELVEKLKPSST